MLRRKAGIAPADSSEALGRRPDSCFCAVVVLKLVTDLAGLDSCFCAVDDSFSVHFPGLQGPEVSGPPLAVLGFGFILLNVLSLGRSGQGAADLCLMCVQKHQYARILISGFLLVAVGLLVTVVGFWFPLCSPKLEYKNCSFLPMQILGPVAVVVGLGLLITGCIRRKQNFNEMEENQALPEGLPNHSEPHHIIVGDSVVIFPTPPPAYFTEAPPLRTGNHGNISIGYESPPPYYSTFNQRVGTGLGEEESVYTIRVSRASIVGLPSHHSFLPELPPPYQKRESASQDQQAVCP
ncbi:transmembrane protein 171-like [Acipenser ruthenus]|uniref:transmembrane protein 171-like n=1 Tax=Acipenser ruthenus TaxID=7906 RepID=UPI0027410E2E|nr:transmembrane protein 171-like [Acipenser ruthenus]